MRMPGESSCPGVVCGRKSPRPLARRGAEIRVRSMRLVRCPISGSTIDRHANQAKVPWCKFCVCECVQSKPYKQSTNNQAQAARRNNSLQCRSQKDTFPLMGFVANLFVQGCCVS